MSVKPRIVLIPDAVDWILGTWAKEIAKWNSDKYEFVIFPMAEIGESPDLFCDVLAQSDTIHCLTQSAFSQIKQNIAKAKCQHVQLISTVHHIVKFSQVADCLNADKIMVVCQKYLNELIGHGVPKEKLVLIYNGVNADFFSPGDAVRARRSLEIPDGAFVVGFSGKATSDHDGRKGIDVFCRALSQLPGRIKEDVHVVVTGPGWEHLQQDAAFERIVFHHFPFLPNSKMADFYNAVDVYLVTARVEGGPVPLLEAMSCGSPVVTTPVGTALDFVQNGHNGLVVSIDDVQATVDAVERIYRDENLATRLGAHGRETILQNLQWKNTLLKVENLYGQPKKTRIRTTESFSCEKLNVELIAKDSARWQRGIAPQQKRTNDRVLSGGQELVSGLRRLYSRAREALRNRY